MMGLEGEGKWGGIMGNWEIGVEKMEGGRGVKWLVSQNLVQTR